MTIRSIVRREGPADPSMGHAWNPFSFLDGDPVRNHTLMDFGWLPWWSDLECKASFFRPVTSLTHVLDYRVLHEWPMVMHVHSLAWYALAIWAAAALYRRLMGRTLPAWVAVLAALLFTVDEAHAMPVGWLANRNAVIAAAFGILTLLAHDRWRRDGWRPGAVLAPLVLALGLLSKESVVSVGGYLLAYALFLDRGPLRRRLLSLVPCLLVGVVWYAAYKALGHGTSGSAVYIDPAHDPVRFAWQAVRHAPLLLCGQWGLPSSELSLVLSATAFWAHWAWAMVYTALVAVLLAPLVAREPLARFWAVGMLLSVVPACAPFLHDRLLMFVGLGAMGLLAQWLAGRSEGAAWLPASRAWRRLARVFAGVFVAVHLVIAPLLLPVGAGAMRVLGESLGQQNASLPTDEAFTRETVVFANSFTALADIVWVQTRVYRKEPLPLRSLRLCPSCTPATLTRIDDRTLAVRPVGGYLLPPRQWPEPERAPPVSALYMLRSMDLLFRSEGDLLPLGYTVELAAATVEVTALTEDGRPAEATFRFRVPLEDPSLRWLVQRGMRYEPFTPPAVGETVEVPAPFD